MQPYIAHPCCNQLTAVTTGYLLTSITWPYSGLSIDPSRSSILMKLSADKLPVFKWQFFKCIECVYEPHKRAALFTILFQTDLGRENAASYYRREITFIAMATRWSRSMSNFNALIGQNLIKGELMRKIYAASGNLFTDSWSWWNFVPSSADVFNRFFPVEVKNEIQLLSRFLCYSWLFCLLGFWSRNAPLVKFIGNPI